MVSKLKGYICGAVAAATYGTIPLFTLPLYSDGMSADAVLFYRYLIAVPVIAVMLLLRGRNFHVARRNVLMMIVMASMMSFSSIMLFESYRYMSAGIASTMLFVYPLMVAVIMAVFFRERLTLMTVVCIAMALSGIVLLFKGDGGTSLSVTGTVLVMLSALSYSIYIVGIDRAGLKEIPTLTLIFYVVLTGALIFGVKNCLDAEMGFVTPRHWYMWGCIVALAIVPTVISFLCTTTATQSIGPTPTAILGALEPATAVVIGISVFGEQLTVRDWIGLLFILVSVSLVVGGGKVTEPLIRFRRLFPRIRRR